MGLLAMMSGGEVEVGGQVEGGILAAGRLGVVGAGAMLCHLGFFTMHSQ